MATRSKSSKSSSRSSRNGIPYCALVIATVLAFLLAVSVAILLWKMFELEDEFNEVSQLCSGGSAAANGQETRVWKLYPGFFRSPRIQGRIENLRRANMDPVGTENPSSCTFQCVGPSTTTIVSNVFLRSTPNIPGRFSASQSQSPPIAQNGGPFQDFVYHGCCSAGTRYITPTKVLNLLDMEVEVVQDTNYKQYFLEETCDQDIRCTACTCGQSEPFIYTAVVYKHKNAEITDEKYQIDSIKIQGACKCLNRR